MKPFSLVMIIVLVTAGCATSIPVVLTKPASVNLMGARSLGVLSFSLPPETTDLTRIVAAYGDLQILKALEGAQYFTIQPSGVTPEILIQPVVVALSSNVFDLSGTDSSSGSSYMLYENLVTVKVRYDVILTQGNTTVLSRTLTDQRQLSGSQEQAVVPTERVMKELLLKQIQTFLKLVAPYTVNDLLTLASDELKDPRMVECRILAVNGEYVKALALYTLVYTDSKNFAAGFNGALMKQVLGDLEGAVKDMDDLSKTTSNPQAIQEYKKMAKALQDLKRSQSQY